MMCFRIFSLSLQCESAFKLSFNFEGESGAIVPSEKDIYHTQTVLNFNRNDAKHGHVIGLRNASRIVIADSRQASMDPANTDSISPWENVCWLRRRLHGNLFSLFFLWGEYLQQHAIINCDGCWYCSGCRQSEKRPSEIELFRVLTFYKPTVQLTSHIPCFHLWVDDSYGIIFQYGSTFYITIHNIQSMICWEPSSLRLPEMSSGYLIFEVSNLARVKNFHPVLIHPAMYFFISVFLLP